MMLDPTFSLGNIFTVGVVIFSAGGFYVATRSGMKAMSIAIGALTDDVKELNKVVTQVAVQNQRMDNFNERQLSIEKTYNERLATLERRYDELRRGEGLINR